MGNAASKYTAYGKLSTELPVLKNMGHDDNWNYIDKSMKVFADEKDREQFIHAIIAISTSNGALDLSGADYKLFYSRRRRARPVPSSSNGTNKADDDGDDGTELVATVTALREGRIIAKIEPASGGKDQRAAFLALRRDVEVKLDRILQSIPTAVVGDESGPSTSSSMDRGGSNIPSDLPPPSYHSSAVGMMGQQAPREKA